MSDRINKPYEFLDDENVIIANNFNTHHDWTKTVFNQIKVNIITHLRNEQENKCCYCKSELGFDIKEMDIEHIIPKSEYESFTFHNKNLALSCPACNTKKSTKSVLNKKCSCYPRSGNAFVIVHAHYDNYSTNIFIKDECVYVPRTSKGSDTIKYCELYRFLDVIEKARKFQIKKSPLAQLTEGLRNASESEVNEFIELIKDKLNNN
ncbi:MAG: hypothetical protein GQ564_18050 [Bacteroidales bacterium]|nr:hypothetical protein [Bacteroidales bacterium]